MPLQAHSSVGEHHLDTVGVCGSIPHVPTKTEEVETAGRGKRRPLLLSVTLVAACKGGGPPPEPVAPPRIDAVEACTSPAPPTDQLPVPVRPPADPYQISPSALMGFSDGDGFHPATLLCDLPDRVIVLGAKQTVSGGRRVVGGTAWTLPRSGPPLAPAPITASSPGCVDGQVMCTWATTAPEMTSIEQVRGPQWVATSGWVHGMEDMCRALPDDTIAVCSTRNRLAYVELGCQDGEGPVKLQLGLHDESLERHYDLDVENPVARLYGAADRVSGDTYTYRFTGAGDAKGRYKAASLTIDTAGKAARLDLDGNREDCLAFGLFRR